MELKPGYKNTEGWNIVRLGDFAIFLRNKPLSRAQLSSSGDIHCLHYGDIHNAKDSIISADELPYLIDTEIKNVDFLETGDIIFVDASEDIDGVGKSVEICKSPGEKIIAGLHTIPIRFSNGILINGFKRYLQYIPSFIHHIKCLASGLKVFSTQKMHISDAMVVLPPPAEQTAIATALSDVDALLASLDALIAKKRDMKQAAMQELLTGRRRLPGFSDDWHTISFDKCALPIREFSSSEDNNLPCIELENIAKNSGQLVGTLETAHDTQSIKLKFQLGDVLFGKLRAYQRKFYYANFLGTCSSEIWVLRTIASNITSRYLYQIIQTDSFITAAGVAYGTHMPRSDWNVIKHFPIYLPKSQDEQNAIAAVLSDMDAEIAALEARRAKTQALKQGMMQELLTGRTRLRPAEGESHA